MWIDTQNSNESNDLERAWNGLQSTPSYIERFHAHPGVSDADTSQQPWVFCPQCGFWVEDAHHCPQEVCA